ncbi:MAG: glycosyltransferase family 1 protein [Candidatus Kapaibacteriales bacterium]
MTPIKTIQVKTKLPQALKGLEKIAYNYWWCWDIDAWELFRRIDRDLFEQCNHNPVLLLNSVSQSRLHELENSDEFKVFLGRVESDLDNYLSKEKWFNKKHGSNKGAIAYFSPEYGINESFPNYSGGLGVLSGDHVKSASDLGLPMVAIGLLYQEGYFRQHIMDNGWQTEKYNNNDFYNMPLELVKNGDGSDLILTLPYPEAELKFRVWKLMAGSTQLFLLDTNIPENPSETYRKITNRLYGGDRETRIQQEVLLGIGGTKALEAMGIECSCFHINEGHAAFALLERTKQFMHKYGMDFWNACQITKASGVFTTHTPVPAGNEMFELGRMKKYMAPFYHELGISEMEFLSFGHKNGYDETEKFSMTVLGLRLTTYHNGVSKLHGAVSRDMWREVWNGVPTSEVPIGHVTNGIHTRTFVAPELAKLYYRYIGSGWVNETDNAKLWQRAHNIPNEELWNEKQRLRMQLIRLVRERISQHSSTLSLFEEEEIKGILNPEALTIGFARRFATYKRADLIFRDMERLSSIINNEKKPVQILIAGKAHPHDTLGKETIQRIMKKVKEYGLQKSVVFIEDYDMVIARALVRGCDVWLNNPIRPLEASGTSGMKSALNGGLNFSVLDGWWDEGYNGRNGFSIGEGLESDNLDVLADIESNMIYEILENRITKLFYRRHSYGVPEKWVGMMKEAIATVSPQYSTHRMVKDYSNLYYSRAMEGYWRMSENGASASSELYSWIESVATAWPGVGIESIDVAGGDRADVGDEVEVRAAVNLNNMSAENFRVEVYHGTIGAIGEIENAAVSPMSLSDHNDGKSIFQGKIILTNSGLQGVSVRIYPYHENLGEPFQLYKCKWA